MMNMRYIKHYTYLWAGAFLLLAPLAAFAQRPENVRDVIGIVYVILGALVPVIFTLALIGFLWGAAVFIFQSEDATKRAEGRKFMIYGIIALFVMLAIWGLTGLLGETFGITVESGGIPFLPQLPGGSTELRSVEELQRLPVFE